MSNFKSTASSISTPNNQISSMEKIQRVSQSTPQNLSSDPTSLSSKVCTIQDPSLSQLKKKINDVMIPFLHTVFELKQSAQDANMPSSRLVKTDEDLKEIKDKLAALSKDLELLMSWCQSGLKQIQKALDETESSASPQEQTLPVPVKKTSFWKRFWRF